MVDTFTPMPRESISRCHLIIIIIIIMRGLDHTETHEQPTQQETPPILSEGLGKNREDTTDRSVRKMTIYFVKKDSQ